MRGVFLRRYLVSLLCFGLLIGYVIYSNVTGTCPISALARQRQYAMTGMPAPRWELPTVNGDLFDSRALEGKVAVVNFWATWCGPCVREIPDFIKVKAHFADKPVEIVGISLDEGEPSQVRAFVQKEGVNYPVVMGTREVAALFGGIHAVPTTFVIRPDGTIDTVHQGSLSEGELAEMIEALLSGVPLSDDLSENLE